MLAGLDLVRHCLHQLDPARGRDHLHALGGQRLCDRSADTHAGAGDQRGLANKLQIHVVVRSRFRDRS